SKDRLKSHHHCCPDSLGRRNRTSSPRLILLRACGGTGFAPVVAATALACECSRPRHKNVRRGSLCFAALREGQGFNAGDAAAGGRRSRLAACPACVGPGETPRRHTAVVRAAGPVPDQPERRPESRRNYFSRRENGSADTISIS